MMLMPFPAWCAFMKARSTHSRIVLAPAFALKLALERCV